MKTVMAIGLSFLFTVALGAQPTEKKKPLPPIPELLKQLNSEEAQVRTEAKVRLVEHGEAAGLAAAQALPDASPATAYDLIMVIFHTGTKVGIPALEKTWNSSRDLRVRLAAAMVLCAFDRDYVRYQDFILKAASGDDQTVSLAAMQMLGYIGDPRVVPILKDIFYDRERPDQVRQAAIWDLSHTPVQSSAEALVGILDDSSVDWFYKEIAIAGLRGLASEPGMAEIVNRLLEEVQGLPSGGSKAE